ncbi:MAG TPA: C-type lectin domain-containing protein [Kofleriaceae bacterium]|nr:C-type lectin domain-containing protein [Kofleriaceae bacterium]
MRGVALLVVCGCGAQLASAAAGADARPCEGGDQHATAPDGSCLVWFGSPMIYRDAQTACAAMSAHLAYLKTADVDAAAEALCEDMDTFAGGDDLAEPGMFVWNDGTPFVYTDWEAGEPNDGNGKYNENCLVIAASRAAKGWDDRPCDPSQVPTSGSFPYICQY